MTALRPDRTLRPVGLAGHLSPGFAAALPMLKRQ